MKDMHRLSNVLVLTLRIFISHLLDGWLKSKINWVVLYHI